MTTPLLGPLEKRMEELDRQRSADAACMREAIWAMDAVHEADKRALRTATWLAASGWITAVVLAAALVL